MICRSEKLEETVQGLDTGLGVSGASKMEGWREGRQTLGDA